MKRQIYLITMALLSFAGFLFASETEIVAELVGCKEIMDHQTKIVSLLSWRFK